MKKVLILFAHPRMEKSRANATLLQHIPAAANITFHDLYELYPDFNIDVEVKVLCVEMIMGYICKSSASNVN